MSMNTEPVKTTMRGIAAFIAGLAAIFYAGIDVLQSFNVNVSDEQQAMIVAFVTVVAGVYSNIVGAGRLREQVTPWHPETGAMTPSPSQPIAEPEMGDEPVG